MPDAPPSLLLDLVRRVRGDSPLPALVTAHRGDSQNAPENTLAAFELALAHGASLIEFDVHEAAGGEVVVIHDDKLDRTTDGHGEVARLELEALRELSAGSWFSPLYAEQRIPLLDEVLDICRGQAVPLIEVKVKHKRAPQAGAKIAAALRRHGLERTAVVISRELARVREVHEASPETPLAYLTFTKRQARGATRLAGVLGVDCYWKSLSLGLVEELRALGAFLTPWTVNRARDMRRLLLLGVETIITDCPLTLSDQIEGFEFDRVDELRERFRHGETDVDLEEEGGDSPDGVASVSELELEVDWPEDPPDPGKP